MNGPLSNGEGDRVCVHHWKISEPNGVTSEGLCVLCGAEREFSNVTGRLDRGDWAAQGRVAAPSTHPLARYQNTDPGLHLSDERL